MLWYKAEYFYTPRIVVKEVKRETEHKVFYDLTNELKVALHHQWFRTWDEAHSHLIEQMERQVEIARNSLQRAHDHLGNVKGMKPPVR